MTTSPTTTIDPIALAVLDCPDIDIVWPYVHMRIQGERLRVTRHAIDRFGERADARTEGLFPHLDLTIWIHRVSAIYTLLLEGERGWIQNRERERIYGVRSHGWFFVRDLPAAPDVVVTCYGMRGAFVEEGEGDHQ